MRPDRDDIAAFWAAIIAEGERRAELQFKFDRAAAHWAQASAVVLGRSGATVRVVPGGVGQPVRRLSGGLLR